MTLPRRLLTSASTLAALLCAAPAAAQYPGPIAVAADADLIAVYSQHVEKRLLRLRFDRAAGTAAFAPFGPLGAATFAVGPKGAFTVHVAPHAPDDGTPTAHLFLLDEAGRPVGKPVPSGIGEVAGLAVAPKGDWVAVGNPHGWMATFAVEGGGAGRRLLPRSVFGVSPQRAYGFGFRPEGGLMVVADDWVARFRGMDGAVQRVIDLKPLNKELTVARYDENAMFKLAVAPAGGRFAITYGGGPFATAVFDAAGRRVQPKGREPAEHHLLASGATFTTSGDAVLLYGMEAPAILRLAPPLLAKFGDQENYASHIVALAGGRGIASFDGDDRATLWSGAGKRLVGPAGFENYALGEAAAGADDEAIVAAERGGWVDLFTRQGKFVRRVQTGAGGSYGATALPADGSMVAAFASATLGLVAPSGAPAWIAAHSRYGLQDFHVAFSADGTRIAAAGPGNELRSWPRAGGAAVAFTLVDGEAKPMRVMGLAVSTAGDVIAVADERPAVWLAYPADKRVVRTALPAGTRSVAALPAGAGFAVGLVDGTVVRVGRDGVLAGAPLKASEIGAVGRIVVAPDGGSLIVVEGDEISARHLDWDGKVVAGPVRATRVERIRAAFFEDGKPVLVVSRDNTDAGADDWLRLVDLATSGARPVRNFERAKP
ncbi:MAG: hypothetical protein IPK81_15550 [Rhodospirillales bacterium]|nr:MAG: hypothetical protein IPK81_15550 [Rhodospirillales bacterium]